MATLVFPGQGAQHKRMGEMLFDEFIDIVDLASSVLGYSIRRLCLEDPDNQLARTQYAQPAIYAVNALYYYQWIKTTDSQPDFVAGHSLGEYNALLAANVFDFETGLKLVQKRGELMGRAAGGAMAAIVGLSSEHVNNILEEHSFQNLTIANHNTPSQSVISGPKEDMIRAGQVFATQEVVQFIPLRVSGAFHSKYMSGFKEEFASFLSSFTYSHPRVPVIANATGRPYQFTEFNETLLSQITSPVRWVDSICYLLSTGETSFEELGPGRTLTGLIKAIRSSPSILQRNSEVAEASISSALGENSSTNPLDSRPINGDLENGLQEKASALPAAITAESLGSAEFRREYNLKFAYTVGGMYRGISSVDLVVRMGRAGMLAFFGTAGLDADVITQSLTEIQRQLPNGEPYGINVVNGHSQEEIIDLLLRHDVRNLEASAFIQITPALVKWRLHGLRREGSGNAISVNRKLMAKVSRPEVAEAFMSPAPKKLVMQLLQQGAVSPETAELSQHVPMADDVCIEADSGGHTDQGVASVLMPSLIRLRDEMMAKHRYARKIRMGAAGGIGTPEATAAAFILGADFVLTGSINQCTVEAGTSNIVKDMLQEINVQDTGYAPAGDMFEMGAKVQVLRRGVFFPSRANKLYALYQHYDSLDAIDEQTKRQIQDKYFHKSFEDVYEDVKAFFPPQEIERAEKNPRVKMALIFRWYFGYSSRIAMQGLEELKVDFQVHCGPSLGAFNQWVKGTQLQDWRSRHVDEIGVKIMSDAADYLQNHYAVFCRNR